MKKRKLHINEEVWEYFIGRGWTVVVWKPNGTKLTLKANDIFGLSWNDIERAHWKKSPIANITPSQIKNYIMR